MAAIYNNHLDLHSRQAPLPAYFGSLGSKKVYVSRCPSRFLHIEAYLPRQKENRFQLKGMISRQRPTAKFYFCPQQNRSRVSQGAGLFSLKSCLLKKPQMSPVQPPFKPSEKPSQNKQKNFNNPNAIVLGPLVLGAGDLIADLTGKTHHAYKRMNFLQGREDPVGLVGISAASVFSVISSCYTAYDGYCAEQRARKIGDLWGRILGGLKGLRGAVVVTATMLSLPARGLTLAALATTSRVLAVAAGVFSAMSGTLFSAVGLIYLVTFGIGIYLQRHFDQELKEVLNNPQLSPDENNKNALAFLKGKLHVNEEEEEAIRREVEQDFFYQRRPKEERDRKIESRIAKLTQKKEQELKRVLNETCVEKIKAGKADNASEIIDVVMVQSRKKMIAHSMGMAIGILGISALLISSACTGTIPLAIAAGLGILVTVAIFGTEISSLIEDFRSGEPGKYDKLCLLISSLLGFVAVSVAVFFAATWLALGCALLIGLIWMTINLICYLRLCQMAQAAPSTSVNAS